MHENMPNRENFEKPDWREWLKNPRKDNFNLEESFFLKKYKDINLFDLGLRSLESLEQPNLPEAEARLRARNSFLEDQVSDLQARLDTSQGETIRLRRTVEQDQTTIGGLRQQVEHLRAQVTANDASRLNSLDPKGYYRALGISPELARQLSSEQLDNLIQGVYRAHAKVLHPDAGGDGEEMKKVNAAYDFLKDLSRRAGCGSR